MAVQTFLSRIEQAGFTMRAEGDRLIVSPFSKLTDEQRAFIKRHKAELLALLANENHIRAWLDRIGETDEDAIAEVLEKCRSDPEARAYYLCRATETEPRIHAVPETVVQRWMPGGECYERIRSGWRLSRTEDGGYVWLEPGTWRPNEPADEGERHGAKKRFLAPPRWTL